MTGPAQRVEQLIALATDPAATEQEARTAAHSACKEIRKNDLVVAQRGQPPVAQSIAPQTRQLVGRPARLPTGVAALPEKRRPMHHVVDFDFKDSPQTKKEDFAFPQHLYRR
jgi:hypothetical protein